jgi:radical SAM protein with 4Fe4S-binding SPASM domain
MPRKRKRTSIDRNEEGPPAPDGGENRQIPVLRIVSWNMTLRCPLRCPHCYIDAGDYEQRQELITAEGFALIDQIAEVARPILVLSGGEPLLREDFFEIARYASRKGFRVAIGTSGTLITKGVAEALRDAGVRKAAVSIDSADPEKHDAFRGVHGTWERAIAGIEACRGEGIGVQMNTTVTRDNFHEIEKIVALGEKLGVRDFQLFFLVPTGRGIGIKDITPQMYEDLISDVIRLAAASDLAIRPTCAPQFTRIARQLGLVRSEWGRGCIAGINYCRISPTGEVTPCPYLPVSAGNVRETPFRTLWYETEIFSALRDEARLEGKCGRCEYRYVCGGCRARAYGLNRSVADVCGGLDGTYARHGNYLAEEPWCPYQPGDEV